MAVAEVAVAEAGMMKALVGLVMMVQTVAADSADVGFDRVFGKCTWRRNSTTMRWHLSISLLCCCC